MKVVNYADKEEDKSKYEASDDNRSESLSMQGLGNKTMFAKAKETPFNLYYNKSNLVVRIDDT